MRSREGRFMGGEMKYEVRLIRKEISMEHGERAVG